MAITHNAVVVVADDGTSPVGSDEWNAAHTIGPGTITDTDVAAANKDGAAATASMRTLGTGAAAACAGNDARLSDARTPAAHKASHVTGGGDVIAAAVAAGASGLMTGADKTKLDAIGTYAIVAGSGVTSAPQAAWTSVSFGTTPALLSDPSGFYSASQPTRLTVPAGMGGLYQVVGCLRFAALNQIGTRLARILLNAATSEVYSSNVPGAQPPALNLSVFMALAAGDYLELQGYQDSGVAVDMTQVTPMHPRLSLCRLK